MPAPGAKPKALVESVSVERRSDGYSGRTENRVRLEMSCNDAFVDGLWSWLRGQGVSGVPGAARGLPPAAPALPPGPIDGELIDDEEEP